ncbi:hypothetical protein B0T19DRAFT_448157 [Cercophora scortea]|uniref:Uncharacterized protein n=1 Tax=Cercophora scortea TaxID=314031 RepID=A0AAE0IUT3_9PEZI|nr:hypothetical protein B0T19DRAFT_448157 [Cercophora scortea]
MVKLGALHVLGLALAMCLDGCPPFTRGTFVIDSYQLYPENADWDEESCVVWFGVLFNATVGIYDPYNDTILEILEFPGSSYTGSVHIGGVARDPYTGLISILTDSASPWITAGADVSGDHLIMKYDPHAKSLLWTLNITALTQGLYGGFQDVETDARGNTYMVGTWPGTIVRADRFGHAVTPWYLPSPLPPTTTKGFAGLAAVPHTDILLSNYGDGQIYRFDMRAARGTPVKVPIAPQVLYDDTDAIYLPPKYGGSVLLVASNFHGVQVLRSRDRKWRTAEYLGTIPRPNGTLYDGGAVTAVTQMGPNAVYMIVDWIDFPFVPGTVAGPRRLFPMPDITGDVEALLRG